MREISKKELKIILSKHQIWLNGASRGEKANLNCTNLSGMDLSNVNLSYADLILANLSRADLSGTNLRCSDLSGADISNCKGLINPIDFMNNNFKKTKKGYIGYICFCGKKETPSYWVMEENSIIEEICNPNRTDHGGYGIEVVSIEWVKEYCIEPPIWKVLIEWEWLLNVVIPYSSDGLIRCGKVRLLEIVK